MDELTKQAISQEVSRKAAQFLGSLAPTTSDQTVQLCLPGSGPMYSLIGDHLTVCCFAVVSLEDYANANPTTP